MQSDKKSVQILIQPVDRINGAFYFLKVACGSEERRRAFDICPYAVKLKSVTDSLLHKFKILKGHIYGTCYNEQSISVSDLKMRDQEIKGVVGICTSSIIVLD